MMVEKRVVTIDGPAGAGKSTVAELVAKRLGYTHLDTGATYRAVAWAVSRAGIDPRDQDSVVGIAVQISIQMSGGKVIVNGQDVSGDIRCAEMGNIASAVSAYPGVRREMVRLQREIAAKVDRGLVAEGRDMGTMVFPHTPYKIYLDASLEERTRRRLHDLQGLGDDAISFDELLEEIRSRDYRDSHRQDSPLQIAEDAFILDTTVLNIAQVVDKIVEYVNSH